MAVVVFLALYNGIVFGIALRDEWKATKDVICDQTISGLHIEISNLEEATPETQGNRIAIRARKMDLQWELEKLKAACLLE